MHFSEGETCADVWLAGDKASVEPRLAAHNALLTSGCGRGVVLGDLYAPPAPLPARPILHPARLFEMAQVLQNATAHNPHIHGVHTSALFTPSGDVIAMMTDVGRHNTLDKLLGFCLLEEHATAGDVLLTTGRLSSEMVSKAARMGIPIAATLRAVTSTAYIWPKPGASRQWGICAGSKWSSTHIRRDWGFGDWGLRDCEIGAAPWTHNLNLR
ncbi:MAG: formate dehydrogenase accessory sulfurtransferase FdhD [Anaerolineae bacterium]|nr:formate dehydrogenase accessory sulfurtransferase FdhD [Anaerolineae bacterium]